ncbi:hypothetical protein MKEN_00726300 [Mycena kentingensis (nom. inval.)]|nr:hypothetical protein MKEN_00726300 [Mycena kentingensis (nom. inval.)]
MKVIAALVALLPFAYGAAVAREANGTSTLERFVQGVVFMCDGIGFAPPCARASGRSGQCVPIPAGFNDIVSSFGPDSDQDCFIFANIDCTGAQVGPIRNPGIPDLRTVGFNDVMSAHKCFFG